MNAYLGSLLEVINSGEPDWLAILDSDRQAYLRERCEYRGFPQAQNNTSSQSVPRLRWQGVNPQVELLMQLIRDGRASKP